MDDANMPGEKEVDRLYEAALAKLNLPDAALPAMRAKQTSEKWTFVRQICVEHHRRSPRLFRRPAGEDGRRRVGVGVGDPDGRRPRDAREPRREMRPARRPAS